VVQGPAARLYAAGNLFREEDMQANILVLDDEESIRFSFHRFLTAEGHKVVTAESYREALARMDEVTFDLILADIMLGEGCGLDILQEVSRRKLKTSVIIMTAYPSGETVSAGFCSRAVMHLVKPLRQKELLQSVNDILLRMQGGEGLAAGCVETGDCLPKQSL
jgi:DNA-binding response OmpR family regulator